MWRPIITRMTLWPKSAVGPNMHGQPPSVHPHVFDAELVAAVAVSLTLPGPEAACESL